MKAIRYFDSNSKRTAPQQETMETKSANKNIINWWVLDCFMVSDVNVMPSQLTTIDLSASTGDCRIRHTPLPPIKEKVCTVKSKKLLFLTGCRLFPRVPSDPHLMYRSRDAAHSGLPCE